MIKDRSNGQLLKYEMEVIKIHQKAQFEMQTLNF